MTTDRNSQPTRARFVLLAYLGALTFVLYLDRLCIAKAALPMQEELGLSETQKGMIFGAFTIAYGLFEVPTGRWGDRFGSRGVLTRIVVWWSVFTALTGVVPKFMWDSGIRWHAPGLAFSIPLLFDSCVLLMLIRFLFGAGEAGALPNTARVVTRWFPPKERGLAQGTVVMCMSIGGAIAPILAYGLINSVGWRMSFVLFSTLGIIWAVGFYGWFRDDPAEHPGVNAAERELIASDLSLAPQAELHPPIPWRSIVRSANVWLLGSAMTCSAFASYLYMFWYPSYLEKARGVSSSQSAWLSAMVLGAGALGGLFGGFLSGNIERWTGNPLWGRRLMGFSMVGLGAVSLAASIHCESPLHASLFAALACALAHSQQANWWTVVGSISGKHLGSMFGLLNSLGVPGAFGSQVFLGAFADARERMGFAGRLRWDPAFNIYAGVLFLGAICWLFIDPTKSAVGEAAAGEQERSV